MLKKGLPIKYIVHPFPNNNKIQRIIVSDLPKEWNSMKLDAKKLLIPM